MGSWWNRRSEDAALEKDLRALRHDAPGRLVRSVRDQVDGTPSWVRPKVRYALVAVMTAAVLVGGASANMINVAANSTTRAVQIIHHLSGSTHVAKSSKISFTAARQTPAQAQYATVKPKLSIVKGPAQQSIAVGGTATFTITVTNTGTVDLTNVTVSDPLSPNCSKTIGKLAAGASAHYTCTLENVQKSFKNVATVKGDGPGGTSAADQGTAQVKAAPLAPVARPGIKISKGPATQTVTTKVVETTSASGAKNTAVTYGKATFHITVTNTGNTVLKSVKVSDSHSPKCNREFSSIAAGQSKTFSCSSIATSSFTNVATVSGKPPKGSAVSGTGHANVTVKTVTTSHVAAAEFTG